MVALDKIKSKKIQILRGLAIIAVVLIHNTPAGLCQVLARPFLNFCVGMFLFLSGLLTESSKINVKKRLFKVLIPYAIWTALYSVFYNLDALSQLPLKFAYNLLTARGTDAMYYIFVYCLFTIFTPLIDKLARSKYKYIGFIIAPIEILVFRSIPNIVGYTFSDIAVIFLDVSPFGWFTYFYLGYLLGNGLLAVNTSNKKLSVFLAISVILQILEGLLYYTLDIGNCGSQLKITAILTGVLTVLLAHRFIQSDKNCKLKLLHSFGNCSFGVFFAHFAVMAIFENFIPAYNKLAIFPINGIITLFVTWLCVIVGKRILGKFSKYAGL